MPTSFLKIVLVGLGITMMPAANAALDFFAELGIHDGGDDLITVNFTDGSSRNLQAGEFLSLGLGVAWDMGEYVETRLYAGWFGDEVSASNGSVTLSRWTSNLVFLFKTGNWRFGGGAAYHWDIKLDGSGVATNASADFDNALGAVAEIDYYFTDNAYVGLQYINMEYDRLATLGNSAKTFKADSIGLTIGGRW